MDRHTRIADFLGRCARTLDRVADDGPERAGTEALATALDRAAPRPFAPTTVAALDRVRSVADQGPLAGAFVDVAADLPWIATPRADDGGAALALAPLDTAFDLGSTTVGIMYVDAGAQYPLHQHPPQELYLTIAGRGRWRYGGHDDFRAVDPLATLYNHPGDLHSAMAGDGPLVALYVLWP